MTTVQTIKGKPSPRLKRLFWHYCIQGGKKLTRLDLAIMGDDWADTYELAGARTVAAMLGYWVVHRQFMRPWPYRRLPLRIKARTGVYCLVPKGTPLDLFLLPEFRHPKYYEKTIWKRSPRSLRHGRSVPAASVTVPSESKTDN